MSNNQFCNSFFEYSRRKTIEVNIGGVALGANNPIRIQSMTTVDTMDTRGSVDQIKRIVDSGCEYVRLTAPSLKEAKNLQEIKDLMNKEGLYVPLIADIHFTPNAAELAARIVEKVRVNPGNYADKKKFNVYEYTDQQYADELSRVRDKFLPLVKICKEYGTAMRIGTNHGSLSDRIMSRYGDTPLGMVESALEFLRICEDEKFDQIVLSMKASNPQVMIQAYRLLVSKLKEENMKPYPLHLGVTEAGEGEDGRVKSALGIGTLLEDGLGDTVRVSLTEEPEFEAPVARALVERHTGRVNPSVVTADFSSYNPFEYHRRETKETFNFGNHHVPRVIADFSDRENVGVKDLKSIGHFYLPEPDKWTMNDMGADFIYSGKNKIGFMLPNGLREICDYSVWTELDVKNNVHPLMKLEEINEEIDDLQEDLIFIEMETKSRPTEFLKSQSGNNIVLVATTQNVNAFASFRSFFMYLKNNKFDFPVVIRRSYTQAQEISMLYASTDMGGLLTDGFGDGVWLNTGRNKEDNQLAFGILQASRTRISKTEYISCPSCGRTLFDLQQTTAMIRKRTDHLKGLKIGIMGCIVNGPGEMADADYGYVGSGVGKITLYRGQDVVKRGVPSAEAVDQLIEIIREDGNWIEPEKIN